MNARIFMYYAIGAIVFGVLGAFPMAHATVLFSDDFNAGASAAWGNERGSWRDTGGNYDATNPDNNPLTYSSVTTLPTLTDFAVDLDVIDWNDGGVFLRSEFNGGAINGILLVTGGATGTFGGFYWHQVTTGDPDGIQHFGPDLGLQGTNHHLRIEAKGDTYFAYIDGVLQDSYTDPTFTSGSVALYDFSPTSGAIDPRRERFDNVVISDFTVSGVPEPGTLALLALGLAWLGWTYRFRAPARSQQSR